MMRGNVVISLLLAIVLLAGCSEDPVDTGSAAGPRDTTPPSVAGSDPVLSTARCGVVL